MILSTCNSIMDLYRSKVQLIQDFKFALILDGTYNCSHFADAVIGMLQQDSSLIEYVNQDKCSHTVKNYINLMDL